MLIVTDCLMRKLPQPTCVFLLLLAWMGLMLPLAAKEPPLPHYLCAEKRSLRTLLLERWAPHEFPIKVHLPEPPAHLVPVPAIQYRAVQEAFRRWQQAWPRLQIQYVSSPAKDGMRFNWSTHIYRDKAGRWGEAYLPQVFFTPERQVRHWSEINLALRAHPGSAFRTSEPVLLSEREMRDLAIHEIGHALGLPHSDDGNDVMGGGNHFLITELDGRNISRRDVATLELLYSMPYSQKQHPCTGQEGR